MPRPKTYGSFRANKKPNGRGGMTADSDCGRPGARDAGAATCLERSRVGQCERSAVAALLGFGCLDVGSSAFVFLVVKMFDA